MLVSAKKTLLEIRVFFMQTLEHSVGSPLVMNYNSLMPALSFLPKTSRNVYVILQNRAEEIKWTLTTLAYSVETQLIASVICQMAYKTKTVINQVPTGEESWSLGHKQSRSSCPYPVHTIFYYASLHGNIPLGKSTSVPCHGSPDPWLFGKRVFSNNYSIPRIFLLYIRQW